MTKVRLSGSGHGAQVAYDQEKDTIHCYHGPVPPFGSLRLFELTGRLDLFALRLLITEWLGQNPALDPRVDYAAFQSGLTRFVYDNYESRTVDPGDGRVLTITLPPEHTEGFPVSQSSTPPSARTITAVGAATTMVIAQLAELAASGFATLALLEGRVGPELWAAVVLGSVVGPAVGKARGKLGGPTTLLLASFVGKGAVAEAIRRSIL